MWSCHKQVFNLALDEHGITTFYHRIGESGDETEEREYTDEAKDAEFLAYVIGKLAKMNLIAK